MTDAGARCGASFSSSENTLALITGNGEWTEWKDVVPSKYASYGGSLAVGDRFHERSGGKECGRFS